MIFRKLSPSFLEAAEKRFAERGDPAPGPHPTKLIDQLVREYLAPEMKAARFRKSGSYFWRDNGYTIDLLNVQKSQWNDAWKSTFYVNIGVFWKEYAKSLNQEFSGKFPRFHWTAFSRIFEPSTKTWSLEPDSELSVIGEILVDSINKEGFPWYESVHTVEGVLADLTKQGLAVGFERWLDSKQNIK